MDEGGAGSTIHHLRKFYFFWKHGPIFFLLRLQMLIHLATIFPTNVSTIPVFLSPWIFHFATIANIFKIFPRENIFLATPFSLQFHRYSFPPFASLTRYFNRSIIILSLLLHLPSILPERLPGTIGKSNRNLLPLNCSRQYSGRAPNLVSSFWKHESPPSRATFYATVRLPADNGRLNSPPPSFGIRGPRGRHISLVGLGTKSICLASVPATGLKSPSIPPRPRHEDENYS